MTFKTIDLNGGDKSSVMVYYKEDHEEQYAKSVEIPYIWELANSQGAAFLLMPDEGVAHSLVEAAKRCIRRDHDVVSMRVIRAVRLTSRQ